MLDDYTNFESPIIDITPPKPEEVKAAPVIVKTKLNSKKPKKKAKVNIKKATVTLTQTTDDATRSKRVDAVLAKVKKTK